jgi:hypothetical protein
MPRAMERAAWFFGLSDGDNNVMGVEFEEEKMAVAVRLLAVMAGLRIERARGTIMAADYYLLPLSLLPLFDLFWKKSLIGPWRIVENPPVC